MNEKLYTFGREEALEIAKEVKTASKDTYSLKYVDMPKAIEIMLEFRKKKGLGNKVEITLKKEVKLRKTASFEKTIRIMNCPWTGLTYGKFMGVNPMTGLPNWAALQLDEYKMFDLNQKESAANWIILRMCPWIEDSCNSHKEPGTKFWQFNDLRAANLSTVNKVREIVKISQILEVMSGGEMANLARLHDMIITPGDEMNMQIADVHGFLSQIALDDPEKFMSKYKDINRSYVEMLCAGESIGIVTFAHGSGYSALGNNIGLTREDAVSYMRADRNLYALIKGEIIRNDVFARHMEEQKAEQLTKNEKLNILMKEPIDFSQKFKEYEPAIESEIASEKLI